MRGEKMRGEEMRGGMRDKEGGGWANVGSAVFTLLTNNE